MIPRPATALELAEALRDADKGNFNWPAARELYESVLLPKDPDEEKLPKVTLWLAATSRYFHDGEYELVGIAAVCEGTKWACEFWGTLKNGSHYHSTLNAAEVRLIRPLDRDIRELERMLANSDFWRAKHSETAEAYAKQSQEHWERWKKALDNAQGMHDQLEAVRVLAKEVEIPESEIAENLVDSLRKKIVDLQTIIKTHDLCHDLHGKVGRDQFEEGCRRETVAEYGSCGWAEKIEALQKELDAVKAQNAELRHIHKGWSLSEGGWVYQGDGSDHLESLVCPVVIQPGVLMALVNSADAAAKKIREFWMRIYGLDETERRLSLSRMEPTSVEEELEQVEALFKVQQMNANKDKSLSEQNRDLVYRIEEFLRKNDIGARHFQLTWHLNNHFGQTAKHFRFWVDSTFGYAVEGSGVSIAEAFEDLLVNYKRKTERTS